MCNICLFLTQKSSFEVELKKKPPKKTERSSVDLTTVTHIGVMHGLGQAANQVMQTIVLLCRTIVRSRKEMDLEMQILYCH